MLDDIPELAGDEIDWPDDWTERDRIHAVADVIHQPRTAAWIAREADVDEETARGVLNALVDEDDAFERHNDGYYWDRDEQRRQELEELRSKPTDELREELEEVEQEIAKRREEHDADSPEDLDDSEESYDWRLDEEYRELLLEALNDS